MGIIQLLDTKTANKIAAGEVVINPASVVKELVENSLDAGSTRITVEILSGGMELIKVIDNGTGIHPGDLETAFKRHATSKIKHFEDLNTVSTMGFRGEALAAIAAVSKVCLTSRTRGNNGGNRVLVEGGISQPPIPIGCAEGTTVEVAHLFYNVPARRKFLKSTSRETAAVNEVVSRLAMGFPETAMKLKNDGRTVFETYGTGDIFSTIVAILGKDTGGQLIPVNNTAGGLSLTGFVSNPFFGRSSRKYQYFYVNQRWVANTSMRYALDHAYRTLLPKGRYPTAILFLETNPALVDVNVDPTKHTVRISNEKVVLDFIIGSVRSALSNDVRGKTIESESRGYSTTVPQQYPVKESPAAEMTIFEGTKLQIPYQIDSGLLQESEKIFASKASASVEEKREDWVEYQVLAQLAKSYILYEKEKSLYIVDQHAAHEKVRYEAIKGAGKSEARQLVIPQTVSLNPRQMALVEQLSEIFTEAGFQFDYFGGSWVVLREIPVEISYANPEEIFLEILDMTENNQDHCPDVKEAFIRSLACKTAVKAGQTLSPDEMESLLEALFACMEPQTCPHGRPTTICISAGLLLKEFKRV